MFPQELVLMLHPLQSILHHLHISIKIMHPFLQPIYGFWSLTTKASYVVSLGNHMNSWGFRKHDDASQLKPMNGDKSNVNDSHDELGKQMHCEMNNLREKFNSQK